MSYKGKYKPQNPQKYIGDVNNIIYRSLWERRFMVFCDATDAILKWSSEEIIIPYYFPIDKKVHKYFVDFVVQMKDKDNNIKTYLIEIKPAAMSEIILGMKNGLNLGVPSPPKKFSASS